MESVIAERHSRMAQRRGVVSPGFINGVLRSCHAGGTSRSADHTLHTAAEHPHENHHKPLPASLRNVRCSEHFEMNPNQIQRLPDGSSGSVSIYRSQSRTNSHTASHLREQPFCLQRFMQIRPLRTSSDLPEFDRFPIRFAGSHSTLIDDQKSHTSPPRKNTVPHVSRPVHAATIA